jgi:hypothetical protein
MLVWFSLFVSVVHNVLPFVDTMLLLGMDKHKMRRLPWDRVFDDHSMSLGHPQFNLCVVEITQGTSLDVPNQEVGVEVVVLRAFRGAIAFLQEFTPLHGQRR